MAALEALRAEGPQTWCIAKNLAVFDHTAGNREASVAAFRRYLELRPDAPDRPAIERRIEAMATGVD